MLLEVEEEVSAQPLAHLQRSWIGHVLEEEVHFFFEEVAEVLAFAPLLQALLRLLDKAD